jgi:hypothetical protein
MRKGPPAPPYSGLHKPQDYSESHGEEYNLSPQWELNPNDSTDLKENKLWRIRRNDELEDIIKGENTVRFIKSQRI